MMSGLTPLMNYTIVEDQCGDIFTNTKVIDGYEHGTSLVSFTMFEFVSDIPKTTAQTNHLKCSVKLCLVDDPCESTADQCWTLSLPQVKEIGQSGNRNQLEQFPTLETSDEWLAPCFDLISYFDPFSSQEVFELEKLD